MKELAKGTLTSGNKWMAWKEFLAWLEQEKGQKPQDLEGTFVISFIFPPSRFPTATIVFWVDELDTGVKKAIPAQQWASLASLFPSGKPVKGMTLYISFSGGEYAILMDDTPTAVYTPTPSGGWELV